MEFVGSDNWEVLGFGAENRCFHSTGPYLPNSIGRLYTFYAENRNFHAVERERFLFICYP